MHAANGKVQYPLWTQLFNLGFEGEGGFLFLFFLSGVADVFLPCSQVVPKLLNLFPKGVPNTTIFFAQNPRLLTDIIGVFFARGNSLGEKL